MVCCDRMSLWYIYFRRSMSIGVASCCSVEEGIEISRIGRSMFKVECVSFFCLLLIRGRSSVDICHSVYNSSLDLQEDVSYHRMGMWNALKKPSPSPIQQGKPSFNLDSFP